jgi:pyruvate kinase
MWIVAFAPDEFVCQQLQFSYGVHALHVAEQPESWLQYARRWSQDYVLEGSLAILLEGSGTLQSGGTRRIDVLDLQGDVDGHMTQSALTP